MSPGKIPPDLSDLFNGDDDGLPPIFWPLLREMFQQVRKGGEVTISFHPRDKASSPRIEALSNQLRELGIKLVIESDDDKDALE